jgi:hypothetical protein
MQNNSYLCVIYFILGIINNLEMIQSIEEGCIDYIQNTMAFYERDLYPVGFSKY